MEWNKRQAKRREPKKQLCNCAGKQNQIQTFDDTNVSASSWSGMTSTLNQGKLFIQGHLVNYFHRAVIRVDGKAQAQQSGQRESHFLLRVMCTRKVKKKLYEYTLRVSPRKTLLVKSDFTSRMLLVKSDFTRKVYFTHLKDLFLTRKVWLYE